MKLIRFSLISAIFLFSVTACSLDEDNRGLDILSFNFNFEESAHGWVHGFADYPAGPEDSAFYELQYAYGEKPGGGMAVMLSGNNHSDDLFMFLKKKITGLRPESDYTLTFEVEMASNAPKDAVGAGGAPGESVFVKVGATSMEPKRVIEGNNFVMNIDKGNQGQSGEDMIVIGDIATVENATGYSLISRSNLSSAIDTPLVAKTNSKGELWLIVGTDSGFEGTTTLYYTKIFAILSSPE